MRTARCRRDACAPGAGPGRPRGATQAACGSWPPSGGKGGWLAGVRPPQESAGLLLGQSPLPQGWGILEGSALPESNTPGETSTKQDNRSPQGHAREPVPPPRRATVTGTPSQVSGERPSDQGPRPPLPRERGPPIPSAHPRVVTSTLRIPLTYVTPKQSVSRTNSEVSGTGDQER